MTTAKTDTDARVAIEPDIDAPKYLINRELTWLEFNNRVLEEALDESVPLLDRLKFLSIFSSNLDEFFMIRVANLREAEAAGVTDTSADGMTPVEQLEAIAARTHELVREQYRCLDQDVLPAMRKAGIHLKAVKSLRAAHRKQIAHRFEEEFFPVLTPMTVDPSHPFPHLANESLNLVVEFEATIEDDEVDFAIVEIPAVLDRLIELEDDSAEQTFVLLGDVVAHHVEALFDGLEVKGTWLFRVTRDSDLSLEERDLSNLLQDIERELRDRIHGRVVRIEVDASMPLNILNRLQSWLQITDRDTYQIPSVINLRSLMGLAFVDGHAELKDPPFNPRLAPRLASSDDIFTIIRDSDLLLHHPYESFSTVIELIQAASRDSNVLAIKLTLYRTSGDAVIINALKDAARNGKQVTALVELKARFDERANITWARSLEKAGVHVVYGIVGLKTHCKALLVVRREESGLRRYVHLSTGNYNSTTARLYTDIGLLSADPIFGEDISHLFNILTGYKGQTIQEMMEGLRPPPKFKKVSVAPFNLHTRLLQLIDDEIRFHTPENPGLIRAKMNSLSNASMVRALYRASCAGVRIELVVRGICCLRPGIPGVSENIRVTSVVDRFLEHPRIYYFKHGGEDLVYLASADMMGRNLFRRIELFFPVEERELKARLMNEILHYSFVDNVKARLLRADGTYAYVDRSADEPPIRSQERFIELAREAGLKSIPYEQAVRSPYGERGAKKKSKGRK